MEIQSEIITNFAPWNGHGFVGYVNVENILSQIFQRFSYLSFFKKIELSILLSSDQEIRKLNKARRGQDKPTNILSFPSFPSIDAHPGQTQRIDIDKASMECREIYLGDLALAYQTFKSESAEYKWPEAEYFAYLLVHGVCTCWVWITNKMVREKEWRILRPKFYTLLA